MKIARQTEGTLVLHDTPWLIWLVGVSFLAGGLVAFFSNEKIFGGAFVLVAVFLILAFANTVTSEFNRTTGRFRRTTRGILRNNEIAHALGEIVDVDVVASASGNPSRSYRVVLTLASGEHVPLTPSYSSGKDDKERLAATVRQFLNLQQGPAMPGFGEMVGMMFDPNAVERVQKLHDDLARRP